MKHFQYLIVGAGIIGLTIAYELKNRYPLASIGILDKENDVAKHASGRNSGVLHAGFYYTEDSLKAKFTVEGNKRMKAYCAQNNLPVNPTQKLVVARCEDEIKVLEALYQRGLNNGVELTMLTADQATQFEPNVFTVRKALLSPTTASVNPREVCLNLKKNLQDLGVEFVFNQQVKKINKQKISTNNARYSYDYLVNAAGLYADKLAQQMGHARDYILLPFKGRYLQQQSADSMLKTAIYPVPDLNKPFLGVHFTKTVDNEIKIGPTAIPAFWREQYSGFSGFKLRECLQTGYHLSRLMLKNSFQIRKLAISELKKYKQAVLLAEAQTLVKKLTTGWNKLPAGIRAQLFDTKRCELVMDFVIEHGEFATHVLNAVSPAFTCSFAFAEYVVDEIEKNRG